MYRRITMWRTTRAMGAVAIFAAMAGAASGCGSSDKSTGTGPTAGIFGSWVLTSVNGGSLPAQISGDASSQLLLDSETIVLSEGGLFSDITKTTLRDAAGSHDATSQVAGTYTTNATGVAFASTNDLGIPVSVQGTINGFTMTKASGSNTLTFAKH
jgi:hypothetical protein